MRVIALEEHFSIPELIKEIDPAALSKRGHFGGRPIAQGAINPMDLLPEIGERRIAAMDEAGISMQVLSHGGPGPDLVPGPGGVSISKRMNDRLAELCGKIPTRFAGFAVLPMANHEDCAAELERSVKELGMVGAMVHGTTEGRFLDHPGYDTLLAAAVELDVPIYIHPNVPTLDVRKAYYSELPTGTDRLLAMAAWGWHSEVAIHVLRLLLTGAFDRHRRLKVIIGHMGEMLPVMLGRLDDVSTVELAHLNRSPSRTLIDQVWITTSGIFTQPPFLAALQTFGIDRIMFSVDYPFSSNLRGRDFLSQVALSPADMEKLCHSNAENLLKLNAR